MTRQPHFRAMPNIVQTMTPDAGNRPRRWLWWLLGAVSVLLAPVAACGGCVVYGAFDDRRERSDAQSALTRYLQNVEHGDYHDAYGQLCIDVLSDGYSEADHADYLRHQPVYTSFRLGVPTETTGIDGTYLTFPVRLDYTNGESDTVPFTVGMETKGPRICDSEWWHADGR